ncbi:MAG: DsbA family protein [Halobacteria archaeon]|nr:DsbA family protein [Halobacteria archaeon]
MDDIDEQPRLGPKDADKSIVAFEDPSCPSCRRFETRVFPRIKSQLVEPGRLSFYFRVYPVVYPWGEPAAKALEATYARDESVFWDLKDHYYANQGSFGTQNVLRKTEDYLNSNTQLDGSSVVEDVRAGTYDDEVRSDYRAGQAAGANATPTFYLFSSGELVTKVVGPQSYTVFKNSLGL